MSSSAPLDVKVVYTASGRRRRRRRGSRAAYARGSYIVLLGLMNLGAAGGVCYGVWWWQDKDLKYELLMHTRMPGIDPNAVSEFFAKQKPATSPGPRGLRPGPRSPRAVPRTAPHSAPWQQTLKAAFLPATVIGWEVLATAAAFALALSGGALVARAGWRTIGLTACALALGGAGYAFYSLWIRYERFTPDHLRTTATGIVVVAAILGLIFRGRAKGFSSFAAILLILSAAGTAGGLHIGARYGAVPAERAAPTFLAIAFGIHSFWGWVLLILARRIPR